MLKDLLFRGGKNQQNSSIMIKTKEASKIMNKGGIITIHDTDKNYVDNFVEIENHEGDDLSGPSEFVKTIDKRKFEVINFFNHGIRKDKPSSTGLTLVRKK